MQWIPYFWILKKEAQGLKEEREKSQPGQMSWKKKIPNWD